MVADIFTVVDLGATDADFLAQAARFARGRSARLRVAATAPVHATEHSFALASGYPFDDDLLRCARTKQADTIARLQDTGAEVDVVAVAGEIAELAEILVSDARTADLALIGPPSSFADHGYRRTLVEHLALFAGRPVLTLPDDHMADRFASVAVGWNGSREATRALNDALPLLDGNALVDVIAIDRPGSEIALEPICNHLRRLGHSATPHRLTGKGEASEHLLGFARRSAADLLVIGAYGHRRFQEMLLGGVTRDLIDCASIPVLFSH